MLKISSLFAPLIALLFWTPINRADDLLPEGPKEEGVEFLGRGPVHEAYAQPMDPDLDDSQEAESSKTVAKEPPPALDEEPPEEKPEGEDIQWVPGYWQWDDERKDYIWISGVWRNVPPGRKWAPGAYVKVEDGYQRSPGLWVPETKEEVEYIAPPPQAKEETPPPPKDNSIWVPGCWLYKNADYRWQRGYYVPYRANWSWVPSCWRWTPAGYLFVKGYWDHALSRRGWLYAPCAFAPGFPHANYRYVPRYVVSSSFLPTSLFVRRGWNQYYYGDYYRARGYTPFVNYRIGRSGYDPLYAHYRRSVSPARLREVRRLYTARTAGKAALPPHTLRHQQTALRNAKVGDARRLTVLRQPTATAKRPITRVTPRERSHWRSQVKKSRDASRLRRETEAYVRGVHGRPVRKGDKPHVSHLPSTRSHRSQAKHAQPSSRKGSATRSGKSGRNSSGVKGRNGTGRSAQERSSKSRKPSATRGGKSGRSQNRSQPRKSGGKKRKK